LRLGQRQRSSLAAGLVKVSGVVGEKKFFAGVAIRRPNVAPGGLGEENAMGTPPQDGLPGEAKGVQGGGSG